MTANEIKRLLGVPPAGRAQRRKEFRDPFEHNPVEQLSDDPQQGIDDDLAPYVWAFQHDEQAL